MADENNRGKWTSQEDNVTPDTRQDSNNRDINKGSGYGQLNESSLPDFQFTPPPPNRDGDDE